MARISSTAAGTGGARRRGVKNKAVAAELSQEPVVAVAAAAGPSRLQRWLERARALGMREPQELVFELHVRQGVPLLVVAQELDLSLQAARRLWEECLAERAARAPKSELEFTMLREHLREVLWQTVEATYPQVSLLGEEADAEEPKAKGKEPGQPLPPMLSVRLKAADQIARLYDLGLVQSATGTGPLPYATPEEIAESVRLRLLEMHRREE